MSIGIYASAENGFVGPLFKVYEAKRCVDLCFCIGKIHSSERYYVLQHDKIWLRCCFSRSTAILSVFVFGTRKNFHISFQHFSICTDWPICCRRCCRTINAVDFASMKCCVCYLIICRIFLLSSSSFSYFVKLFSVCHACTRSHASKQQQQQKLRRNFYFSLHWHHIPNNIITSASLSIIIAFQL